MLNVANKPFMLSAIMLNVIMLNVIMLNVVMLNVVVPGREDKILTDFETIGPCNNQWHVL